MSEFAEPYVETSELIECSRVLSMQDTWQNYDSPVQLERRSADVVHYQLPSRSPEDIKRFNPKNFKDMRPHNEANRHTQYHRYLLEIDTESGCVAFVGKMGAMKYVLDPLTGRQLTPGAHEIRHMDDTSLVTSIGGNRSQFNGFGSGVPNAVEHTDSIVSLAIDDGVTSFDIKQLGVDPSELQWGFPVLHDGNKITEYKLGSLKQRQPLPTQPAEDDLFNLTTAEAVHPQLAQTTAVYETALGRVLGYAKKNKQLRESLTDATAEMPLPNVTNESGARFGMTVATSEYGSTQLIFNGYNSDGSLRKDSGFHLVHFNDGQTVLYPVESGQDAPIDSPEYADQIRVAGKVVDIYFDRLNVLADSGTGTLNMDFEELKQHILADKKPGLLRRVLGK